MSLYIATLDEIKADQGIEDTTDDAVLTRWGEGLQGRFEDYCNRGFVRSVDIEEYHNGGERSICLRTYPVEEISAIEADDVEVPAASYRAMLSLGRIYPAKAYSWPHGVQYIRVVYTGGYQAAGADVGDYPMPEGLRRAFMLQFGYEWRNRENLGRASMSAQGQSVSLAPASMLAEVKQCLTSYRRF
jgi:hypothetical protein